MHSYDSLLAYHALLYILQALSDGNHKVIQDMGLTTDEIRQLSQLPAKSIKHMACLSDHFLEIKTDHDRLSNILTHLHQESANDERQDELLRLEAPITMMQTLFGMSTVEYLQRRKLLGMTGCGAGRPPLPSDEAQVAIWESWIKTAGMPLPERYQRIAQETGKPLRVLWSLIQSWESIRNPHKRS